MSNIENIAQDYAKYFKENNLEKELKPISANIDEMLARLEEFGSLFAVVEADTKTIMQLNAKTLEFQNGFDELCQRIDNLEKFVGIVNENLIRLEETVEIAEQQLGVNDYSLKNIFKPLLFGKGKSTIMPAASTNLIDGEFRRPEIFKTENFFTSN